ERLVLQKLYIDRKLVRTVLNSIRKITKDNEKYVDYGFLKISLHIIKAGYEIRKTRNPSSSRYRDESIDDRLNNAIIHHTDLSNTAKNYIIDRVDLYKNLVLNHKKKSESITQRLMNSAQDIAIKRTLIRTAIGISAFATGIFTGVTLRNRPTEYSILENSNSNSDLNHLIGNNHDNIKENRSNSC
ncbi:hypothetical protein NEIRO03_2659, partial [Nematocida sp. AWRm78]